MSSIGPNEINNLTVKMLLSADSIPALAIGEIVDFKIQGLRILEGL